MSYPPSFQGGQRRPPPSPFRPQSPASDGSTVLSNILFAALGALALAIFLAAGGIAAYAYLARDLPAPDELQRRAANFQTSIIYDREGSVLNQVLGQSEGRRQRVSLAQISPKLLDATIATEDVDFYSHGGVDPIALVRVVYLALRNREAVSGGSTITQQLVKLVFLSPERTATRKIKEAVLSEEITRTYSKDQILEIYLNEIYYGNMAYGIEAASQIYFGKSAKDLNLSEASLLAGLPQGPALYDPYTKPQAARDRQANVLRLMVKAGKITPAEADAAWLAWPADQVPVKPVQYDFKAPHFTLYVREQLENDPNIGPEKLYKGGLRVYTTLDPKMQQAAEDIARTQIAQLRQRQVNNAALVAMRPQTGEILAMIGSVDFNNKAIDGQVNVALAQRQPGSSIKPLTYLTNFDRSQDWWTPATPILDVLTQFPDGANPPYVPTNYDNREHGIVSARIALANSYNIPAVKALQHIGIAALKDTATKLGITTLTRPDYGLALTLGGGDVTLLQMTGAFATFANLGVRVPPTAIQCIADSDGNVIYLYVQQPTLPACQKSGGQPQVTQSQQVFPQNHVYLLTHILSDNVARVPAFGPNSVLQLSRPAAVKTGTTNDYKDNWTIGYTPDLVTGVWVGNMRGEPMQNVSGVTGAGPIWHDFMEKALAGTPVHNFPVPSGVTQLEVCADSGTVPNAACPQKRLDVFASDRLPPGPDKDWHQRLRVVKGTNLLAPDSCPADQVEEKDYVIYPAEFKAWAAKANLPQPPTQKAPDCRQPSVKLLSPEDGKVVAGIVPLLGDIDIPNFDHYELRYGLTFSPGAFSEPFVSSNNQVRNAELGRWDTQAFGLQNGQVTLLLLVVDKKGQKFDARTHIVINNSATPTTAPSATPQPLPSPTALPTITTAPTTEPTVIQVATPTLSPGPTVIVVATPTLTPLPTVGPTLTVERIATLTPSLTSPPPTTVATPTPVPSTPAPVVVLPTATRTATPTSTSVK